MSELDGLRVAISAAASGIGFIVSRTLMKAGAQVFVCDVDQNALRMAKGELNLIGVQADVSIPEQASNFINRAAERLNGIDVLINNAGIAGPTARVEDIDIVDWQRTFDVNISGHFFCTRAALSFLRSSRRAQIINMASVAGRLGYAYRTPYASSKWAVIGFTKSLAKELGPDGIRVNAVLPGIVDGPRTDGVIQARAKALGVSFEEMRELYLEKISMRSMVSADDVADLIAFLCSSRSKLITGQTISVDGNVENL